MVFAILLWPVTLSSGLCVAVWQLLEGLAKDSAHLFVELLLHEWGVKQANGKYRATKQFRDRELVILARYDACDALACRFCAAAHAALHSQLASVYCEYPRWIGDAD